MSLHLEFEPHSWYMGFAIKHEKNAYETFDKWVAFTDDGNTYSVVELHNITLKDLKAQIRQYHLTAKNGYGERIAKKRLEYLRGEIEAERISYGEISELESLKKYIQAGDVELLELAGVPEEVYDGNPSYCI